MRMTVTLSDAEGVAFLRYVKERRLETFPPALIARELLVVGLAARALVERKRKGKA